MVDDPALFVRGGSEEIARFAERAAVACDSTARSDWACSGNPLSDFPGLPVAAARARRARRRLPRSCPACRARRSRPRSRCRSCRFRRSRRTTPGTISSRSWRGCGCGCPWDREQTHRTLVPYLIEETFEVVEAIENAHLDALCEELGDLLLQIALPRAARHRGRQVQHRRRRRRALEQDGAPPSARLRRRRDRRRRRAVAQTGSSSRRWRRPAARARAGSTAFPSISARCSAANACKRKRRASASTGRTSRAFSTSSRGAARAGGGAPPATGRPARARGARRRLLHPRQPLARARHRRRDRDARGQRKVLPALRLHGRARDRRREAAFPTFRSTNSRNYGNWRRPDAQRCACA